jgi:hypothetical protein
LNPPHAVSTFEEAEVNERRRYLAMAVLLTILTAVVTVYHGTIECGRSATPIPVEAQGDSDV